MTQQERSTIIANDALGADIFRITFQAPRIAAEAKPGQFAMVRLDATMDPLLRRPFSIHQVIGGNRIQLLYKVVGRGSMAMSRWRPRDTADIIGPLGAGFDTAGDGTAILVGGGIGIAPLFFLARTLLRSMVPETVFLLLGARTVDELLPMAAELALLGLQLLTATDDGSHGHHGLVTDLIDRVNTTDPVRVFGCGPYAMLRSVAFRCQQHNLRCQLSLETMMACGIGACLGCALPRADRNGFLHVCKDGPVVDAREVGWK